jgi:GTPase SAR1 family protein
VTNSYLRGAAGAILVCDLTRADTLPSLQRYADDIRKACGPVQLIVAANKIDLPEQHLLTADQVAAMAQTLQASHFFTSAKVGDEVDEMFRLLGKQLLD